MQYIVSASGSYRQCVSCSGHSYKAAIYLSAIVQSKSRFLIFCLVFSTIDFAWINAPTQTHTLNVSLSDIICVGRGDCAEGRFIVGYQRSFPFDTKTISRNEFIMFTYIVLH